jgi:hypothetical protein
MQEIFQMRERALAGGRPISERPRLARRAIMIPLDRIALEPWCNFPANYTSARRPEATRSGT